MIEYYNDLERRHRNVTSSRSAGLYGDTTRCRLEIGDNIRLRSMRMHDKLNLEQIALHARESIPCDPPTWFCW